MITVADVRSRIETDLDDATIQRMIDAATEELESRHGAADQVTDYFLARGSRTIVLSRRPVEVVEVRERRTPDADDVILAPEDYRQQSPMVLLRVGTTWGYEVQVDYVPFVNADMRDRITLDLVQLDIEFRAFESERVGDWQREETQGGYVTRREALHNQLHEPARGIT